MSTPRYAHLASKMLSQVGSQEPPEPTPDERAQAITAIAQAIATDARRRRLRRWGGAIAAVAAVALSVFGGYRFALHDAGIAPAPTPSLAQIVAHPVGGGSSVVVSGAQGPLDDGRLLGPGSRVVTPPNGRAMLSFSTGTSVLLHEGTDMTVAAEGAMQRFQLDAGSVELHVAKLTAGQRFVVATADSEVEVRGTRFSVSVVASDPACGAGVRTRVAVTEGVVVVRHANVEERVALGEEWPAGCTTVTSGSASPAPRAAAGVPAQVAPSSASSLADQNDLFAAAASARRRGDTRAALAALDRFLTRYPASPLAESATVERMRALQSVGSARASGAARDYLARFPGGFAHAEAEAIATGGP